MLEFSPSQAYATLEVEPDADERALRRAYARKLKELDQALEPEKFQALRQAYEWALQRQLDRAAPFAVDECEAPAPPPPEPDMEVEGSGDGEAALDLDTLRHVPLQRLEAIDALQRSTSIAHSVLDECLHGASQLMSSDEAEERLRKALARPELLNLEARLIFESSLASVLAEGWQPGHEHLFMAAIDVLGWREQRMALNALGHAAGAIDQAIEELEMLEAQAWRSRAEQQELIRLLRQPGEPSIRQLLHFSRRLGSLENQYPHLLTIVTRKANIGRWQHRHQQIPRWRRHIGPRSYSPPPATKSAGRPTGFLGSVLRILRGMAITWLVILAVTTIIPLMIALFQTTDHAQQPAPASQNSNEAAGLLREPVATTEAPIVLALPAQARAAGLQGSVSVYALISPDGSILTAHVDKSSGHGILDEAALDFVQKKRFAEPKGQDGQPIIKPVRIPISFLPEKNPPH